MSIVEPITGASVGAEREPAGVSEPRRRWWHHRRWIAAVLFGLYGLASLFVGAEGYLSTDVGGKTGSLWAMVERGDWDLDMGYWAEEHDPEGINYPMAHTTLTAKGQWVNTTSVPMVYAARPLWQLGGPRAILLLPILGSVATALAAAALHERIEPGGGHRSMWVIGLASPAFVYALDFWEHSIGLALMTVGVVAVIDTVTRPRVITAAIAGIGFGAAATMRQEALVYGFVAGVVLVVALWRNGGSSETPVAHRLGRLIRPASVMAGTAVAITLAYAAFETALYGSANRADRGVGTAAAVGSDAGLRAKAAFVTFASPFNAFDPISYVFGTALLISVVWLVVAALRSAPLRSPAVVVATIGGILALKVVTFGPIFVPGLVPTAPLAAAGLVVGIKRSALRLPFLLAVAPLPLVFLVQYPQGALVQWGGRYLLLSGLVLVVIATVALPSIDRRVFLGLAGFGLAVTLSGVWWTSIRTTGVDDDWEVLRTLPEPDPVIVWRDPVKAREAGHLVLEGRWLAAPYAEEQAHMLGVLDAVGADRFAWIDDETADPTVFEGWTAVSEVGAWNLDTLNLDVTLYERDEPVS